MTRYLFLTAFVLLPLTACGQQTSTEASSSTVAQIPNATPSEHRIDQTSLVQPPADACNPPMHLVGQPRTVLQTMKFGTTVRIIEPGQPVTQDYSPQRLNILLDEHGKIEQVKCG